MEGIKYIQVINNVEEIEQALIITPRYRRCCYNVLERCKVLIEYFKNIENLSQIDERYIRT